MRPSLPLRLTTCARLGASLFAAWIACSACTAPNQTPTPSSPQPEATPASPTASPTPSLNPSDGLPRDMITLRVEADAVHLDASSLVARLKAIKADDALLAKYTDALTRHTAQTPHDDRISAPLVVQRVLLLDQGRIRDDSSPRSAGPTRSPHLMRVASLMRELHISLDQLEGEATTPPTPILIDVAPSIPYATLETLAYTLSVAPFQRFIWAVRPAKGSPVTLRMDPPNLATPPLEMLELKPASLCIVPWLAATPKDTTWRALWSSDAQPHVPTALKRAALVPNERKARLAAEVDNNSILKALEGIGTEPAKTKPSKPKPSKPQPSKPNPIKIVRDPPHPHADLTGVCAQPSSNSASTAPWTQLQSSGLPLCKRAVISATPETPWSRIAPLVGAAHTIGLSPVLGIAHPTQPPCAKPWPAAPATKPKERAAP